MNPVPVDTTRLHIGFTLLVVAAAIPKAGLEIAGIPIPFMYFALLGGLLLLSSTRRPPWYIDPALVALILWAAIVSAHITISSSGLREPVAVLGWLGLPLTIIGLSSVRRVDGRRTIGALFIGVRIAIAYGFLQLLFGVKEVAVPGITRAVGEDLDAKPLKIFLDDFTFWKIPTTYQNGNNFGVIAACCFAIALSHPKLYRSVRWQLVDLCLFVSAILLAGSRTVFIGWVISTLAIFLHRGIVDRATTIKIFVVTGAAAAVTLALQPGLLSRFSPSSLTERGGAGRTRAWSRLIDHNSMIDWVVGSASWAGANANERLRAGLTEGWGGISQQVGIIGAILLVVVWVRFVRPVRAGIAIVIPLAVSAVLDSAYLVFPTIFIPAALIAALTTFDNEPDAAAPDGPVSEGDAADADTDDPRPRVDRLPWIRWTPPARLAPTPQPEPVAPDVA